MHRSSFAYQQAFTCIPYAGIIRFRFGGYNLSLSRVQAPLYAKVKAKLILSSERKMKWGRNVCISAESREIMKAGKYMLIL